MFENIMRFFRKMAKKENKIQNSKEHAKERLHLVLLQDRANVSADFLDLMRQEIIDVIKKYIEVDENAIDVRLTNKDNGDGTTGAPALYANIPIMKIKEELKPLRQEEKNESNKVKVIDDENSKNIISQEENEKKQEIIIEEENNNKSNENVNNKDTESNNEIDNDNKKIETNPN